MFDDQAIKNSKYKKKFNNRNNKTQNSKIKLLPKKFKN